MFNLFLKLPDPVLYAIPVFLILILIEYFIQTRIQKKKYNKTQSFVSMGMGIGASFIKSFNRLAFFFLFWKLYQYRIFDNIGADTVNGFFIIEWHINHWYAWVILFFLDDLTFYIMHRAAHLVRFLWAGHINHHSSNEFNLAIALRQGWWEYVFKLIFWIWLPLLGFHPLMIFLMIELNLIYQFFPHTELIKKLGFLELFLNTPSHHRVHHSSQIKYLDKNYAGVLIIWDKIFGTFKEEEEGGLIYGLTKSLESNNLFVVAFHEFGAIYKDIKRADSFKNKLNYLIQAPGWSHDGEDLRSKTLQKKINS